MSSLPPRVTSRAGQNGAGDFLPTSDANTGTRRSSSFLTLSVSDGERPETQLARGVERSETQLAPGGERSETDVLNLIRTIEGEIIPRLMLSHRMQSGFAHLAAGAHQTSNIPDRDVMLEFVELTMRHDTHAAMRCVADLREHGMSLDTLYLELLAPCARYLGELWTKDLCGFTEVTIGLCCLHEVLRELSGPFQFEGGDSLTCAAEMSARRMALVPVPGEQHTFGMTMVAEFMRRAGWTVWMDPAIDADSIVRRIATFPVDVLGISLSAETHLETLASLIALVRRQQSFAVPKILVGGPLLIRCPEVADRVGADGVALDARHAIVVATELIKSTKPGC